jgi:cysteine desulfurase/selenocysteine lyase
VVWGWAEYNLKPGDIVLTTVMEHHANIVPWQEVCIRKQAELQFVNVDAAGRLDLAHLEQLLRDNSGKIKLVALTHVSNVLGTKIPIEKVVALVKATTGTGSQPRIVVDGAQAAPHFVIDFDTLGVDFYAFSGHKMLGPMGVGGLIVRKALLESNEMRPWYFGGGMIAEVRESGTTFSANISERFTPGTPDVASAVGLAAACDYLHKLDMQAVYEHDQKLIQYTLKQLSQIPEITVVGPTSSAVDSVTLDRVGAVSFVYRGVHAHDVAQVLDSEGIAVRSGHHCTMPLHLANDWQATVRVSFQVYNTEADIDALVAGLAKVKQIFHP